MPGKTVTAVSETVPSGFDGERVDRFVAALTGRSRSAVAALLDGGAISVDGRAVSTASLRLHSGQQVSVEVPPELRAVPEPDPAVDFTVVYSDEHIVVVDKPPGLVVHPGPGHPHGTLVNGLLARFAEIASVGDPQRPGIVHRLDKDTSGLLVVARTSAAHSALVKALAAHLPERVYTTLVWGRLYADEGTIDAPIGRSVRNRVRMTVSDSGRAAITRYRVLRRFERPCELTLLECRLETGRTHQIRVHLRAIGHPVAGDRSYDGARPGIEVPRPFLHACRLGFAHPISGGAVAFSSALPDDLAAVLAQCSDAGSGA